MGKILHSLKIHLYLILIFYIIYTIGFYLDPNGWEGIKKDEPLKFLTSFYYVFITHTTIGFGDIYPKKIIWRLITVVHIMLVYIITIINIADFSILININKNILKKSRLILTKFKK